MALRAASLFFSSLSFCERFRRTALSPPPPPPRAHSCSAARWKRSCKSERKCEFYFVSEFENFENRRRRRRRRGGEVCLSSSSVKSSRSTPNPLASHRIADFLPSRSVILSLLLLLFLSCCCCSAKLSQQFMFVGRCRSTHLHF